MWCERCGGGQSLAWCDDDLGYGLFDSVDMGLIQS